jgi:hypothetical protein
MKKFPKFVVSATTLKILAALVWYSGGLVLILKGASLLLAATDLKPELIWPEVALFTGVILGSIKAKFLFLKSCQKNLERIKSLDSPKIWQFFRPKFFLFLILMISLGIGLSQLTEGHYTLLVIIGILDISISIALLISSSLFWKKNKTT